MNFGKSVKMQRITNTIYRYHSLFLMAKFNIAKSRKHMLSEVFVLSSIVV